MPQLLLRPHEELLRKLNELVKKVQKNGIPIKRTAVATWALSRGIDQISNEMVEKNEDK